LEAGRPVLAIAANLDQLLNMRAVERLQAGATHPVADPDAVATAIESALTGETLVRGAREAARVIAEAGLGRPAVEQWLAALLERARPVDRH
jgi:UDP:flavonoid glycosyltransferase YjiC (YdhE family)